MDPSTLAEQAARLAAEVQGVAEQAATLAQDATALAAASTGGASEPFVFLFTVFVLSVFIGYYVVWSVTPALHSPLMAITNAISSVIIVGAILAVGVPLIEKGTGLARFFGFIGIVLASVNIFGGFLVTQRMLGMYKKKG
jgi:NAD(P) transhydrogenase subunit alpha